VLQPQKGFHSWVRQKAVDGLTDDALERLFDEARHLLTSQRENLEGLDTRLSFLLRFDAVMLGIVVTLFSIFSRTGGWTKIPFWSRLTGLLSIGFLLSSVPSVVLAYQSGDLTMAFGPNH
jgi:hypothetical protein